MPGTPHPVCRRFFLRFVLGGTALAWAGCVDDSLGGSYRRRKDLVLLDGASGGPDDPGGGFMPDAGSSAPDATRPARDAGGPTSRPDAGDGTDGNAEDASCDDYVEMHDMVAQSLYFDGTMGPETGTILVAYLLADEPVELDFWHGHGGNQHRFTVTPEHFAALKRGERVMVETSSVDSHTHQLFIDPVDPRYRAPGSTPTRVPNC